jgi:peptidoglycan/xylan/chitin deacetylase (PgdA/CDA1 family)/GT2 family glycosyltransferase
LLVGLVIGSFACMWYLDVVVSRGIAAQESTTSGAPVRTESPVVGRAAGHLISSPRPRGASAITFTGGPDPSITPKVLDELDHLGVHATFFLDGTEVLRHPGLASEIVERGNEVGTVGLGGDGLQWRARAEARRRVDMARSAIEGATGRSTTLVRIGNPRTPAVFDGEDRRMLRVLRPEEHLVHTDRRANPRSSTVAAVIAEAMPVPKASAVIDFPVTTPWPRVRDALRFVVAGLRGRKQQVVTLGEFSRLPRREVNPKVGLAKRGWWAMLITAMQVSLVVRSTFKLVVGLVLIAGAVRAIVGMVVASRQRRSHDGERVLAALLRPPPTVTVVIAAHNEAAVILGTLRSVLESARWSRSLVTVVLVDDGSTDGTADLVERWSSPEVFVARRPHEGKGAALNYGLQLATTDLVVMIDADTHLAVTAIERLADCFDADNIGAVSGRVHVGNARNGLGWCQQVEYAVANGIERRLLARFQVMTCVPGALGAYRLRAVRQVGGLPLDTVAEDTDLTLTLQESGWRVKYAPSAEAWTFAPVATRAFLRQRVRWSLGVMQNVKKHRRTFAERRHGRALRLLIPYLVLFGGLSVLGPVVDFLALYGLATGAVGRSLGIGAVMLAVSVAMTCVALRLERQPLRYVLVVPLQLVLYRPLVYLSQLRGLQALLGEVGVHWGVARPGADAHELPATAEVRHLADRVSAATMALPGHVADSAEAVFLEVVSPGAAHAAAD